LVWRIAALRDHTLQAVQLCGSEELGAVVEVIDQDEAGDGSPAHKVRR
jgi:hypothetical protein